jgi:putative PIN family toxin of toxin-antitoxin system
VVSERLLVELRRALRYPRLRERIPAEEADEFVHGLRELAIVAPDPRRPPRRSADPGDDYLLALAESERAVLVSGDRHLLDLAAELPVRSPSDFLTSF